MVVVDESASMADADGTGARADAVAAARDFLAAHGLADDRIGVTWFADSADVEGPALASAGTSTSAPADLTPLGTGTNIASALQQTVAAQQRGLRIGQAGDRARVRRAGVERFPVRRSPPRR